MAKYSNHKKHSTEEGYVTVASHDEASRFSIKLHVPVDANKKPIWHCLTLTRAEALMILREIEAQVNENGGA